MAKLKFDQGGRGMEGGEEIFLPTPTADKKLLSRKEIEIVGR